MSRVAIYHEHTVYSCCFWTRSDVYQLSTLLVAVAVELCTRQLYITV